MFFICKYCYIPVFFLNMTNNTRTNLATLYLQQTIRGGKIRSLGSPKVYDVKKGHKPKTDGNRCPTEIQPLLQNNVGDL